MNLRSLAATAAIAAAVALAVAPGGLRAAIRVEAEDAELVGVQCASGTDGYSGRGYVTGLDAATDRIAIKLQGKAGIYETVIRYGAPHGEKGCEISVNGRKTTVMLPGTKDAFASFPAGKVEFVDGSNSIEILKGWGWYDVDYIEFTPAKPAPALRKPPKTLADPNASAPALKLIGYLVDNYGSRTLSGQYDQYDGKEVPYIREVTGRTPAVLGCDLMDYTPSRIAGGLIRRPTWRT